MRIVLKIFVCLISVTMIYGQEDKPLVVASASMIADIAKNIGGNHINIEMIVPIGGDPHLHEPTPDNVRLVANADIILINGLTFEGWITELIDNSGTDGETYIVTDGVEVLTNQTYKNSADPHAWMNASNGIIYAQNIKNALVALDPTNESSYEANYSSYMNLLKDLHEEIITKIQTIPADQRILITSHDAFQYYGEAYNIRLEAIIGISTEAEAQTSDIIRVNKVIREHNIPAIFVESTINPKLINQLATDNDISIGGELYADSLGDEQSPADTYINMLRYNTETIVTALSQSVKDLKDQTNSHATKTNTAYLWGLGLLMLIGLGLFIHRLNR